MRNEREGDSCFDSKTMQPVDNLPSSSSADEAAEEEPFSYSKGNMTTEELLYETTPRAKAFNRKAYGMQGIMRAIRENDPDYHLLALGVDLTTLGYDLNYPGSLFSVFPSPWAEQCSQEELDFRLPTCYYENPPAFKPHHITKFDDETLFYIFYNMNQDILQGYAALELYKRHYFYHPQFKKWFNGVSVAPSREGAQGGKTSSSLWMYFEPSQWKKKPYNGELDVSSFLQFNVIKQPVVDLVERRLQNTANTHLMGANRRSSYPPPTAANNHLNYGGYPPNSSYNSSHPPPSNFEQSSVANTALQHRHLSQLQTQNPSPTTGMGGGFRGGQIPMNSNMRGPPPYGGPLNY